MSRDDPQELARYIDRVQRILPSGLTPAQVVRLAQAMQRAVRAGVYAGAVGRQGMSNDTWRAVLAHAHMRARQAIGRRRGK